MTALARVVLSRTSILMLVVAVATVKLVAAPAPPQDLQVAVAANTVTFTWMPVAGASSYRLEAGAAPGGSELAALVLTASNTYSVPNVPAGVYYVRLRALDAGGASAPSNEVTVVVGGAGSGAGCPAPPAAPTSLRANVEGTRVNLAWTPSASGCPATAFIVRAGSAPGTADIAQLSVSSATLSTTAPDGLYFVSVVATNAFGASSPTGSIIIPIAAPSAGGRVGFNTASPSIVADSQGHAVVIGEVVNRSLAPAVFIQVNAEIRDANGNAIGAAASFLRGQPRRLSASGIMDDSALAPGEIGCFYIPTSIPLTLVRNANLQLAHENFASTVPRSKVNTVDVTRLPGTALATLSVTAANAGPDATMFNVANLYLKRSDGRAVGCDFAFVANGSPLAPGQVASMTTATHAPSAAASSIAWMHWQESGDPLAGLAAQTFSAMLSAVNAGDKRSALLAWESLQEQRRAAARQVGR